MAEFEDVLETMRQRIPWAIAQKAFRSVGISPGQGWSKTEAKILDDTDDLDDTTEVLSDLLIENILCGDKIVRFYDLPREELDALRQSLERATPARDALSEAYPASLVGSTLQDQVGENPQLVAIERRGRAIGAIFASMRTIETREKIKVSHLPPQIKQRFASTKKSSASCGTTFRRWTFYGCQRREQLSNPALMRRTA